MVDRAGERPDREQQAYSWIEERELDGVFLLAEVEIKRRLYGEDRTIALALLGETAIQVCGNRQELWAERRPEPQARPVHSAEGTSARARRALGKASLCLSRSTGKKQKRQAKTKACRFY